MPYFLPLSLSTVDGSEAVKRFRGAEFATAPRSDRRAAGSSGKSKIDD